MGLQFAEGGFFESQPTFRQISRHQPAKGLGSIEGLKPYEFFLGYRWMELGVRDIREER